MKRKKREIRGEDVAWLPRVYFGFSLAPISSAVNNMRASTSHRPPPLALPQAPLSSIVQCGRGHTYTHMKK